MKRPYLDQTERQYIRGGTTTGAYILLNLAFLKTGREIAKTKIARLLTKLLTKILDKWLN